MGDGRRSRSMDPAVLAALDGGRPGARGRGPGKQRRKRARPGRVTLELDPRIAAVIREVAAAEGVSPAGVVNLFVAQAVERYRKGELVVGNYTRDSRNTVYDFVVVLDDFSF